MKQLAMTRRKDSKLPPAPPPGRAAEGGGGAAFDLWLERGLHQLYDGVAREPIPPELLRLIEDDREGEAQGEGEAQATVTLPTPAAGSPER